MVRGLGRVSVGAAVLLRANLAERDAFVDKVMASAESGTSLEAEFVGLIVGLELALEHDVSRLHVLGGACSARRGTVLLARVELTRHDLRPRRAECDALHAQ